MDIHRQRCVKCALVALLLPLLAQHSPVHADSIYNLAPSSHNRLGHLGFQSKWHSQWFQRTDSYLGGYWDASLSRDFPSVQRGLQGPSAFSQELGLTAVLRYQRNDGTGFYAQAGAGPQYQSISHNLAGHPQGSHLAINTVAGVGFVWRNGVDLGFKAVHVTRGQGLDGNEAASMIGIGLQYRW